MDRIKDKLKMGQKKSKQAAKSHEDVENTNSPAQKNIDNGGSYSPPRGMKDILNSESKTTQFRAFLKTIDEENENNVEVLRLDFVLACRKMSQLLSGTSHSNPLSTNRANAITVTRISVGSSVSSSSGPVSFDVAAVKTLATEMLENYFHPTNKSKIVILENSALPKKCGNVLGNVALSLTGSTMPENSIQQLKKTIVQDAHLDALKLIEPLHQVFLRNRQREATDVIQNLQNCLL